MSDKLPRYWMINDRDDNGTGVNRNRDGLTYWVSFSDPPLNSIDKWQQLNQQDFKNQLVSAANNFPPLDHANHRNQSHITILIHGYNNSFSNATSFYQTFYDKLFDNSDNLNGLCILYDWPSFGNVLGYEPDRSHARQCAEDFTDILSELYDWLLDKQRQVVIDPSNACRAKVSVIAHSMGNYLLQKAMALVSTRKNKPLLVSLINQLIMVAADVDNTLFDTGAPDNDDGSAIASLTYRITSLFSGRDDVLGASAGLKHFGTRRLGRSGLAHRPPIADGSKPIDNVWDIDCSGFFPDSEDGSGIHSAYFHTDDVIKLMRQILRGVDRAVLETLGLTKGGIWP